MNRGQRVRQGPKRKPLLVNLSSYDDDVLLVQQVGPSGTRQSRSTSWGQGQSQGSNREQIRPNFGNTIHQNKNLPSASHHSNRTTKAEVYSESNLCGHVVKQQQPAKAKAVLYQLWKLYKTKTTIRDRKGRTIHHILPFKKLLQIRPITLPLKRPFFQTWTERETS